MTWKDTSTGSPATHTTSITHDAGRETSRSITADDSHPLPAVALGYDAANWLADDHQQHPTGMFLSYISATDRSGVCGGHS